MDWETALFETMAAFTDQPPKWGVNDCCQFAADYVDRMGGQIELPEYDSEMSALRLLADGLEEQMRRVMGEPTDQIKPGDVVLARSKGEEYPGIYNGSYVVLFHPEHGVSRSTGEIVEGWTCRA